MGRTKAFTPVNRTAQSFGVALESVDRPAVAPGISARLRTFERSYSSAFTEFALAENKSRNRRARVAKQAMVR